MQIFLLILITLALALAQVLIGGTRQLYSIPAVAILGIAAIASGWPRSKPSLAVRSSCVITAVLLAAYVAVRNRLSPVDYLARTDLLIVAGSLMVYLLFALFLDRSKSRLRIFFVLLALALAHAVIGAIQFKRGDQFMLLPWIHRTDDWWRASGFYISPNHFAGLMEVMALISLSVICWSSLRLVPKILVGYGGVCCVIGLLLSGSRGGYLSFSFGLLIFIVLSLLARQRTHKGQFWPWLLGALAALLLVGLAGWVLVQQSGVLKSRIAAINDPENMRWRLWGAAIEQFRLEPLWGTGSGTYYYYGRLYRDPLVQTDPIYVHNDYLHLLAEYGAAGAAVVLIFLLIHLIGGVRNVTLMASSESAPWEARANQLAIQLGALSAIAAYIAHSVVDFNIHVPANAFLIAMMFGIVANPAMRQGDASRFQRVFVVMARLILVAAGISILLFTLPKLPGEWYAEQARVALRDYHLPEARSLAAKALQYEKKNPDIYYYAGEAAREMAAQKQGPVDQLGSEAIKMFQAGLAQFPEDLRTLLKLAQAYDDLRQFDLADETLEQATLLDPENSLVSSYYGLHYQMQGMLYEAQVQYEAALALDGSNKMASAGLAVVKKMVDPLKEKIREAVARDQQLQKQIVPDTDQNANPPAPTP